MAVWPYCVVCTNIEGCYIRMYISLEKALGKLCMESCMQAKQTDRGHYKPQKTVNSVGIVEIDYFLFVPMHLNFNTY